VQDGGNATLGEAFDGVPFSTRLRSAMDACAEPDFIGYREAVALLGADLALSHERRTHEPVLFPKGACRQP
jgi:hypothetical protein